MLAALDELNKTRKAIPGGWKAQTLVCYDVDIKDDFRLVAPAICESTTIRVLQLNYCQFNKSKFNVFLNDLATMNLVTLMITGCAISAEGTRIIATRMQECLLEKLDLAYNPIGDEGLMYISGGLADSNLLSLRLSNTNITATGAEYLGKALQQNRARLQILDLATNQLRNGCISIFKGLPTSAIHSLRLDATSMTPHSVDALCESIIHSPTVVQLSLGYNSLGDDGVCKILRVLNKTNVEEISFINTRCTDVAALVLAEVLQTSLILRIVNMQLNHSITVNGVSALYKAVYGHRSMENLLVEHQGIADTKEIADLASLIQRMRSERVKTMTVLMSSVHGRHNAAHCKTCKLDELPKELVRMVGTML